MMQTVPNRYLLIATSGGLNQQRTGVSFCNYVLFFIRKNCCESPVLVFRLNETRDATSPTLSDANKWLMNEESKFPIFTRSSNRLYTELCLDVSLLMTPPEY